MKTLKLKSTMLQLHLYAYRTIWSAISGFWGKTERQTAFYLNFSGQSGVCGVSVYHANLFSLRDRQQGVFGRRIQSAKTHDLGSSVVVTNIGRYQILGPFAGLQVLRCRRLRIITFYQDNKATLRTFLNAHCPTSYVMHLQCPKGGAQIA